jgi:DNA-binding MarR family transcriptional regulator
MPAANIPRINANDRPDLWAVTAANTIYSITALHLPDTTTLGELRILTVIALAGVSGTSVTTKEVSDKTGLPPYQISRIVARYLENGILEEKPHPSDGRSNQICFDKESQEMNVRWSRELHKAMAEAGLVAPVKGLI